MPVVLDVETGGLNPLQNSLLEIAIVLLDWKHGVLSCGETHTWAIAPHPDTRLDESAIEVLKFDPWNQERETKSEEQSIRECFRLVRKRLRTEGCMRAYLVGHNAHFDRQFLKVATHRNGIGQDPFHDFTVIDTASLAGVAYGHTVLQIACDRAGITYEKDKAHSAAYDAMVTAELFCRLVNRTSFSDEWATAYPSNQT